MNIDFLQAKALAEIMLDTDIKESLLGRKFDAINKICASSRHFLKEYFVAKIVLTMTEKKLDFIVKAKTIKEVDEIESVSVPRFDGNKLVPRDEYHIEEEELLMFSFISLKAPLRSHAYERYLFLFKKLLPEYADKI